MLRIIGRLMVATFQIITDCMSNIRRLAAETGKEVMIVETGMEGFIEE